MTQDQVKREFAEELISYTNTCLRIVYTLFKGDPMKEAGEIPHLFLS